MRKQYFFMSFVWLFVWMNVAGQQKPIIVYKETMHFAKTDMQSLFDSAWKAKEKWGDTVEGDKNKQAQLNAYVLKSMDSVIGRQNEAGKIMHCWREKEEVVVLEMSGPAKGKILSRYHLKNQSIHFIDSFTYRKINDSVKIITQAPSSRQPVTYTTEFLKETKNIFGYPCEKIIIVATIKTINEPSNITRYEIWATKAIQPALSVDGLLLFQKPVLPNYTALEIKEMMEEAPDSYGLFSAIEIKK